MIKIILWIVNYTTKVLLLYKILYYKISTMYVTIL